MSKPNRIKNRQEFKELVDKFQHGGKLRRIRQILLEEQFDEHYKQAEALVDVLMSEVDFKKKQVLMAAIYLAVFELGRGRFIRDDIELEEVLAEVKNKPDKDGDFEKALVKLKNEAN